MKLHSASCSDFATALGGGFLTNTQAAIEKEMGIAQKARNWEVPLMSPIACTGGFLTF